MSTIYSFSITSCFNVPVPRLDQRDGNKPRRLLVSHRGYTDTHDLMPTFTLMSKPEFVVSADLYVFASRSCKMTYLNRVLPHSFLIFFFFLKGPWTLHSWLRQHLTCIESGNYSQLLSKSWSCALMSSSSSPLYTVPASRRCSRSHRIDIVQDRFSCLWALRSVDLCWVRISLMHLSAFWEGLIGGVGVLAC